MAPPPFALTAEPAEKGDQSHTKSSICRGESTPRSGDMVRIGIGHRASASHDSAYGSYSDVFAMETLCGFTFNSHQAVEVEAIPPSRIRSIIRVGQQTIVTMHRPLNSPCLWTLKSRGIDLYGQCFTTLFSVGSCLEYMP